MKTLKRYHFYFIIIFFHLVSCHIFAPSVFAAPPFGLYGLSDNVGLIRVFNNGTMVPVGLPLPNELQAQELSCIDEKHGILYAIFYDESKNLPMFTGVSLSTGAIVSSVPVPFAESSFIGVGQMVA